MFEISASRALSATEATNGWLAWLVRPGHLRCGRRSRRCALESVRLCPTAKGGEVREVFAPSNKALKLTRLSAAPGLSLNTDTDGGAASCARGRVGGRTASQLNAGVRRTRKGQIGYRGK